MGATLHSPADRPRMIAAIPRRPENTDLASIPVGLRAIEPTPMALRPEAPALAFRLRHRLLNILVRVPRPPQTSTINIKC